jgi:hypothetical protein
MLQIKLFILNNLRETRKEKDTNKNGLMVIVTSLKREPPNLPLSLRLKVYEVLRPKLSGCCFNFFPMLLSSLLREVTITIKPFLTK